MVTWIGGPVLDPLGAALGSGFAQGLDKYYQTKALTSDTQSLMEYLQNLQTAQQRNMMGIGAPQNPTDVPGPADWSSMVAAPKLKTPEMQKALLQLELGRIMDPMQRAQIRNLDAQTGLYQSQALDKMNPMQRYSSPERIGNKFYQKDPSGKLVSVDAPQYEKTDPQYYESLGYSTADAELAARRNAQLEPGPAVSSVPWWADPKDPNYSTQVAESMRQAQIQGGTGIGDVRGRKALEIGKSIQAGTATIDERHLYDRLMSGNETTINMPDRLPKEWYTDLEKNIVALDNVRRIKHHMRPGGGGSDTVGVRNQIVTWIQSKLGQLPAEKAVYTSDKAMMYRLIKQTAQESRMSDQDLAYLANILPQEWQSDESFRAVLDSIEEQSQQQYNRQYDVMADPSMKAALPASYGLYYTGTNSPKGRQSAGESAPGAQEISSLIDRARQKGATEQDIINLQTILQSGDSSRINAAISRIQGQ